MLEELVPLTPVHFFQIQVECIDKKRILLPDLSPFHGRSSFAKVFFQWEESGVTLFLDFSVPFKEPDFPNFQSADSIELFFDTRDVKTTGFNTRFCHHFFFLPKPMQHNQESIQSGEITRFRTEERHALCEASKLKIQEKIRGKFEIFIPKECLYGYDPTQFNRLGFAYRINRLHHEAQVFSADDQDFTIEQQPSVWASLLLRR